MEIEPLLTQIADLAPHFGRVTGDLLAIVSRGRSGDYKGVMQNTRLVLEAILRDLVTRELKQTPGKAMLDELITKFRQQANAGVVPTNILAHMGTVQAWGNLSSHDHAGSLSDAGVEVGPQEVAASLNSMAAILSWYAARTGVALDGTYVRPISAPVEVSSTAAPTERANPTASRLLTEQVPISKSRAPMIVGVIASLALLIAGFWFASRPTSPGVVGDTAVDPYAALDAIYRARHEPSPPKACRRADEAAALAAAKDENALLALHGPEADYQLARLRYEAGTAVGPELDRALACSGFAAALALSGKAAVREAEAAAKASDATAATALLERASRELDAAIAAEPTFKNARFNRALVLL